jgi:SnoaL-like polyketide cyclase
MGSGELAPAAIDAYNRHDLADYKRLHTSDARVGFAGAPGDIGLDHWLRTLAGLTDLPDLTIRPVTMLTDDATAVLELRQMGTHTGVLVLDDSARALLHTHLDHIPPTGRTLEVTGVVVLATARGDVTGERHHWPRPLAVRAPRPRQPGRNPHLSHARPHPRQDGRST